MTNVITSSPYTWQEDPAEERQRRLASVHTPPDTLCRLYPLSARLKVNDPLRRVQHGTLFAYARARRVPSVYPIEVFVSPEISNSFSRWVTYSPEEAELLPPTEMTS